HPEPGREPSREPSELTDDDIPF
ncbi:MAG: hypothetical protein H6Q09_386, partial [Acidobacteria bacterium]|nr:hypothetical protein [Acidobacteriota bacterium]